MYVYRNQNLSRSGPGRVGHQATRRPSRHWIIWLVSIGIFLPYTIGDTGKYVIAVAFLGALPVFVNALAKRKRKAMACDAFVCLTASWMVMVKLGSGDLFTTASDALAFLGAYIVARSFFHGDFCITGFVNALKFVAIILIALAFLDTLSGRHFTNDLMRTYFHIPWPVRPEPKELHRKLLGAVVLRAELAFPHPILFGVFCSIAATIFVYFEQSLSKRLFYFSICVVGCILSVSSAAVFGIIVLVIVYCYDVLLRSFSARWKALYVFAAALLSLSFFLSNNPLTWIFRHATIDPADGYYRLLIWRSAFGFIALSPIVGMDPSGWASDAILSNSIDCVWLVLSLKYGLPMTGFLILSNLSACGLFGKRFNRRLINNRIMKMRTAFSLVLFLFAFLGLTVHYWGAIWMFWALCIGIRASIEDYVHNAGNSRTYGSNELARSFDSGRSMKATTLKQAGC